jgi:hypothetical protein
MARSDRKNAAAKFRRAVARGNELHAEYLGDPQLYDAYDRFTRWQLGYMTPFFSDLLGPKGYAEAVDFIVSDLAGVGVSARDREIERATPVIVRSLPAHPLATAAAAVELNARALEINLGICRELLVDGELPSVITEKDYLAACRTVSSYDECMDLVHLAVELGETLKRLVRVPLIGGLRRFRCAAGVSGDRLPDLPPDLGHRPFPRTPPRAHGPGVRAHLPLPNPGTVTLGAGPGSTTLLVAHCRRG